MTTKSVLGSSFADTSAVPNRRHESNAFAAQLKITIEQSRNTLLIELQALGKKIGEAERQAGTALRAVKESSEKERGMKNDDGRSAWEAQVDEMYDELNNLVESGRRATKEMLMKLPPGIRETLTEFLVQACSAIKAFLAEKVRMANRVIAGFAGTIADILRRFWDKMKQCVQLANGGSIPESLRNAMAEGTPMMRLHA
jgi:hypothetical protein